MTDHKFLDRLIDMAPRVYDPEDGRKKFPYWHPVTPKVYKEVVVPSWSWMRPAPGPDTPMVDVDTNAAYIAAASTGDFALNPLKHTGADVDGKAPGYYLIDTPSWQGAGLPSPLGTAKVGARIWIAQPTLGILREVERAGFLGHVPVLDSWTSPTKWKMRPWAESIRDDRAALMDRLTAAGIPCTDKDSPEYKAFKDAYAMAVQMFLGTRNQETGEHYAKSSKVLRPDWYHTLRAQHAASFWRRAFNAWKTGCGPHAMTSPDQLLYTVENWIDVTGGPKPVYPTDPTGRQPGKYKIKGA